MNDKMGRHSPLEKLKDVVAAHVKELKDRYDLQYATHVVAKLRDNNMLNKDGIEKLLIEE